MLCLRKHALVPVSCIARLAGGGPAAQWEAAQLCQGSSLADMQAASCRSLLEHMCLNGFSRMEIGRAQEAVKTCVQRRVHMCSRILHAGRREIHPQPQDILRGRPSKAYRNKNGVGPVHMDAQERRIRRRGRRRLLPAGRGGQRLVAALRLQQRVHPTGHQLLAASADRTEQGACSASHLSPRA